MKRTLFILLLHGKFRHELRHKIGHGFFAIESTPCSPLTVFSAAQHPSCLARMSRWPALLRRAAGKERPEAILKIVENLAAFFSLYLAALFLVS